MAAPFQYEPEIDADDDGDFTPPAALGPSSSEIGPMPTRSHGNTGPKGVLNDYREHQRAEALLRDIETYKSIQDAKRFTYDPKAAEEYERQAEAEREQQKKEQKEKASQQKKEEEEEGLEEDEAELAALEALRQKRLAELQKMSASSRRLQFGSMLDVEPIELTEAIHSAPKGAFVVVHLYEDLPVCHKMDKALDALAKEHRFVKFLRGPASQILPEFDDAALPALLVYRDGQEVATLLRITDDIGEKLKTEDVEWILSKYGVIA